MQRAPFINLPLHTGRAPAYLVRRMIRMSHAMSKVIIDEYGQVEFLRRLSDPLWFQAFGCVLGFDWHSSGVTTVVSGVLKQALKLDVHGISIAGGKGKKSTSAKTDILLLAENFGLSSAKIDSLLYANRMAAKVDTAAVQDGYSLYHHVILFDKCGNWAVVQQGMNAENGMARRYHWFSDNVQNFVREPHTGIISEKKNPCALDMTAAQSQENQKVCVDLAKSDTNNLKSSVYRLAARDTLDRWLGGDMVVDVVNTSGYEMPRRLDWALFKRIYDVQPGSYEELLSIPGVGGATVRALSLIAELIYGAKASWSDPVKYSFAHGGKDGVPYPIARKVYDESIRYLYGAIEGAEIEREERTDALKKLASFTTRMFPGQ
ncbi:MAG: DUF763 domain-containing protein [Nitrososphaera sp.]|uniref:DUF763 domain-containing protein n=1 Tax=Candidatus Nitrososphaera gargensis TaxID=497727 RepID=UPI00164F174E|nr:DUF763 domain-containing protein [Candidatus Nitrososphaera gargensis]